MARTYRKRRKIGRKNKTDRKRKNFVGGSFFSYVINNAASVFSVPIPSRISFDPRVTNQFIYQK
jgi:hypothetical protein